MSVNIQLEWTPNPSTLKYVVDRSLLPSGALNLTDKKVAEEKSPLLTLAVECGYSDHSSLSRQSLRLFGARPGVIRRTLGWEWLMHRWLTRAAV